MWILLIVLALGVVAYVNREKIKAWLEKDEDDA